MENINENFENNAQTDKEKMVINLKRIEDITYRLGILEETLKRESQVGDNKKFFTDEDKEGWFGKALEEHLEKIKNQMSELEEELKKLKVGTVSGREISEN